MIDRIAQSNEIELYENEEKIIRKGFCIATLYLKDLFQERLNKILFFEYKLTNYDGRDRKLD